MNRADAADRPTGPDAADGGTDASGDDPVVTCEFSRATPTVFADRVRIERGSGSLFEDATIPMAEIESVEYSAGLTSSRA